MMDSGNAWLSVISRGQSHFLRFRYREFVLLLLDRYYTLSIETPSLSWTISSTKTIREDFFFLSIVFPFSLHRIAFSIFLLVYPIALAKKNVPSSSDDPFKSRKGNEQNIERGRRRVRRIDNRDCHPRRFTLCRRQYGGRIKKEKENLSSPRSEVLFTLDRVSLAGTNIRSRETMFHGSSSNWLWRTEWIHFAVDSNFSSDSSNTDFFSIRYLPLAICFIAVK